MQHIISFHTPEGVFQTRPLKEEEWSPLHRMVVISKEEHIEKLVAIPTLYGFTTYVSTNRITFYTDLQIKESEPRNDSDASKPLSDKKTSMILSSDYANKQAKGYRTKARHADASGDGQQGGKGEAKEVRKSGVLKNGKGRSSKAVGKKAR